MLTLPRFKTTAVFVALAVLLIGAVGVYAKSDDGRIDDPALYWFVSIYDVGFTGRDSLSRHRYTVENDSQWDFSVAWEYAHKIMNPDGTEFKDVSTHSTNTVKKGKAIYAAGGRGASVPKGSYYLDTYTSIDINYATGRAGHSKKIEFAKVSIVTDVTDVK